MAPPDHRFHRTKRLEHDRDFARVFDYRCSAADRFMLVYACPNELAWSRLGIRVAGRFGTAVERANVRRRVREAFRTGRDRIPAGFDFICLPRSAANTRSVDVAESLLRMANLAVKRAQNRCDGLPTNVRARSESSGARPTKRNARSNGD
jgi:ribonuclease P protein component